MAHGVRQHKFVLFVLSLFVVLGALYSTATPLFEAPDELLHYRFAAFIARGHALLDLRSPGDLAVAHQEGSQAPLYYAVAALIISAVSGRETMLTMQPNPHGGPGSPLAPNKNSYLHTSAEDFPYQGDFLAAHLVRLFSVVLGAGTILFVYLAALSTWRNRTDVAVLAAAIVAFNPAFLFISAAINNDGMVALFSSAILWCTCSLIAHRSSWRRALLLGTLLGLGLLSKASFAAIVPAVVITAFVTWRRAARASLLRSFGLVLLPMAIIGGWFYARNFALYGDPTATELIATLMGSTLIPPDPSAILADIGGLWRSYWAVFGAFNILVHPYLYDLLAALSVLSVLGLVIGAVRGNSVVRARPQHILFLAAWAAVVFGALVRYRLIVLAFHGRLLYPALPAIALLMSTGLLSAFSLRSKWVVPLLTSSVLAVISVVVPFVYLFPAYASPVPLTQAQAEAITNRINLSFGGDLRLVGYDIPEVPVVPGGSLHVTLYWSAERPMNVNHSVFLHLLAPDGGFLGQVDTYPASTMFQTSAWPPGKVFAGHYDISVTQGVSNVSLAILTVGVYDLPNGQRLLALSEDETLGDSITLRKVAVAGRFDLPLKTDETALVFGDKVALAAYRLDSSTVVPGGAITGNLYWRALREMRTSYTVFVQMVSDHGLVAQYDSVPLSGKYPSTAWDRGEVVRDSFEVKVPPSVASGMYQLIVGLYDLSTGERLATGKGSYAIIRDITVSK